MPRAKSHKQAYYLVVSRLVPYKRVDLAIKACNQLKMPLVVVGKGSDLGRLRQLAGPTISFTGYLTDSELVGYYQQARAVLMPQEEDLGLVAIEAQSLGVPVISYRHSGAAEIIKHKKTGILFDEQTVDSLLSAIRQFSQLTINSKDCISHTKQYSKTRFQKVFEAKVKSLWRQHQNNIYLP
jgi:glycosyltransferase involved in cell wall biosynthesis